MNPAPAAAWLFLSCVVPRADGVGIEKRAWSHLMAMAALRAPQLVLALTPAQLAQMPDLTSLRAVCGLVHVLPLAPTGRGWRLSNTLAFLAQRLLLWGRARWRPADDSARTLRDLLQGSTLDQVFCFRLVCFQLWRSLVQGHGFFARRVVVDFDDIESVAQSRALALKGTSLGRAHALAGRLEIAETARLEMLALRHHEVLVCSTPDRAQLLQREPGARVHVVPNSYPVMSMLASRRPTDVLTLLFLGTLSYAPNIDAAEYLVKVLLPEIRQAWQGPVHLLVVGRRPVPAVLALHRPPEVKVLADVQDITTAYAQADVVVVPIRFGGGTRIKILEALSLGRPVVTTTIGVEGLDLQHGQDLLIADTPADFARACVQIGRDAAFGGALTTQGRGTFVSLYGDEVVRERLRQLLSAPSPSSSTR